MARKKTIQLLIIVLVIVIIGCTKNPIEAINSSHLTPIVSPVITSTATPSRVSWDASKSCVTLLPAHPDDYQLNGIVVLRSLSSTVQGLGMSLLNLEDDTLVDINTSNQSVWDADVSPDGQTLAYKLFNDVTSKWELVLIDSEGSLQKIAWASDYDFSFGRWLNDHQVVIGPNPEYIVVDPYQDSREEISTLSFPDFDTYNPLRFFVSFDPFLSRAIYKKYSRIIFMDLSTKAIIVRIEDSRDRSPVLDWKSKGEQLAIVATITNKEKTQGSPDEIFIADPDGKIKQLTHLHESLGPIFTINSLSWSPDGEKIAFWLYNGQENTTTLMIADAFTGDVTNYCVLNVASDSFPVNVPAPIWSPNGKQLLVENRYTGDKSKLLIVDLLHKIAFPIAEDANPIGWMIER